MSDLRFVKIGNDDSRLSSRDFRRSSYNINTFGFMYHSVKQGNGIDDITDELLSKSYKLDGDYVIVYLYDYKKDDVSLEFLKEYGGLLHNLTSANIAILTYFTKDMVANWENIYRRNGDNLKVGNYNDKDVEKEVNKLKKQYGVKNLPSLVIVKNDFLHNDVVKDLTGYNKENLYEIFTKSISYLNEHCEEDIHCIKSYLETLDNDIRSLNGIEKFTNSNYINKFINEINKKRKKNNDKKYTRDDLADALGYSDRQLRNKVNNNSFRRDEIITMGVELKISVYSLNKWLSKNGYEPLGINEEEFELIDEINSKTRKNNS